MSECDPIDVCFVVSLLCLGLGIISASLGLVIKTDYKVDGEIPAREMEKVEQHYRRLVLFLHLCDIFGISMVTTGGCILLLVVVVMAMKGEFSGAGPEADQHPSADSSCHDDRRKQQFPLLGRSIRGSLHGYGSNDQPSESPAGK